ncbi:CheR family methyltransferase [Salipiger thiooxidans]|uniref:CheR family methyltransferase n=1 Tax=Salipiger thiooxidans TaxID=282683 RepID=UPI001CD6A9FE|nr:CheR family methyltransferase [Salipiger thiooxidans]MCA0845919.1 histidine kinase [Salipiger thiooxidans]
MSDFEDDRGGDETAERIPIVAIGASAGGLNPLEAFFTNAPDNLGWCYIIIQHLSPDYRSVMDELLARKTHLKIRHIEDGLPIAPDTIFLNRPNTGSVVEGDVFRTFSYSKADQVPHLPIDSMFASLASRGGEKTAAVILSGSGSDGSNGAQILHASGGALLVQTPQEADFPSMPRAILSLGIHDRIADAADIPNAIRDIFTTGQRSAPNIGTGLDQSLNQSILELLEKQHDLDFGSYKETNVQRRITRRQHLRGIDDPSQYLELLRNSAEAVDELYQDLLIGVTEFYRDPEAISILRDEVIQPMIESSQSDEPLRIWVAGCASGEEAYTIGIEMTEALQAAGDLRGFRIIATDVHRHSIDFASAGAYSEEAVRKIPGPLRRKYFDRRANVYTVVPSLRQKIIFSVHDALTDPPFLDLDLVSCRNLLIYLREEAQARVISMFLFGLKKHGVLFLGPSETLGHFGEEFDTINPRWRLFRKASGRRVFDRTMLPSRISRRATGRMPANDDYAPVPRSRMSPVLREFADMRGREALFRSYDLLLKNYAPSSFLVTSEGEVLSWFGAASAFVDTRSNLTEWSVEHILHRDLHFVINVALEKLRAGELEAFSRRVDVDMGKDVAQPVTLTFEPLDKVNKPRLMLIRLRLEAEADDEPQDYGGDAEGISSEDAMVLSKRVHELERDLRLTEETLQHVTERLEASGEELQASNEELQASNEELQASNEELQSSNEELHAVNEELVTVSAEHERKILELSSLNKETEHLFHILRLGLIVVNHEMMVKRFSGLVARRFSLEPHDINRRLSVIGPRFDFIDLPEAVERVLLDLEPISAQGLFEGEPLSVEIQPIAEGGRSGEATGAFIIFRPNGSDQEEGSL